MKTIKMLAGDIECNIREAQEKIETAYKMKSISPSIALWYRDMAAAHIGFNNKGHDLIASEIQAYKDGKQYQDHPQYVDGMMAIWTDKHADLVTEAARVRAMIDTFK